MQSEERNQSSSRNSFQYENSPLTPEHIEEAQQHTGNGRQRLPRSPPIAPPPSGGPRTPPMPRTGPRTPEGHKGARTPETPVEDEPPRYASKRDHVKRPSTPPEPYPTSPPPIKTAKSGPKSPVSMTAALDRAYKQKGPRTPPPPMDISPPDLDHKRRRVTPPMEDDYGVSPPPAKRRRSRDRSPPRDRDRRSKRSRDRYADRQRGSRSPSRRSSRSPPRSRGRRSPSRSPSRCRRSRRSSRDRYPPSPPRSSRDRGGTGGGDRDRDHGREGQTQSSNLQSSTSLFTEMMKNKKARELIKQKQQKRSDGSSVIVNSELSDPRSQPAHRPPQPDGHREVPVGQHQSSHHRHSQVFPPSGSNGLPVNKKGPKPPPHRPGALPMPPGKSRFGFSREF